jgi:hypothetical protein
MLAVMKASASVLGAVLVLGGLVDIYFAVLFARSGSGPLAPHLARWTWRSLRGVALWAPSWRDKVLSHAGPLILVILSLTWGVVLLTGYGLMFWAQLGYGLRLSGADATRPTLNTALVYSAYCLSSLGAPATMQPQTAWVHWLSALEAVSGFALFTLTLTYILQVGNAVLRRNHVALKLHHSSVEDPDASEMVARLGPGGDFADARTELAAIAEDLLGYFESHHFYPEINYYRFPEVGYDTARMSLLAMDAASLVRSGLDSGGSGHLERSEAVGELWTAGMHFLRDTVRTFLPRKFRPPVLAEPGARELAAWRQRFERALLRFEEEGIRVVADRAAGADEYVRLRRQWDGQVKALARYLVRDWGEVAPYEGDAAGASGGEK